MPLTALVESNLACVFVATAGFANMFLPLPFFVLHWPVQGQSANLEIDHRETIVKSFQSGKVRPAWLGLLAKHTTLYAPSILRSYCSKPASQSNVHISVPQRAYYNRNAARVEVWEQFFSQDSAGPCDVGLLEALCKTPKKDPPGEEV